MLSVRNMLGESSQTDESKEYSKPSALDISFILCPPESEHHIPLINHTDVSNFNISSSSKEECFMDMPWEKQHQLSDNYASHLNSNTNCSIKVSPPVSPATSPASSVHNDGIIYRQRSPRQRHMESKQIERELLHSVRRNSSSSCSSSYSSSRNISGDDEDDYGSGLKAKRRRASSKQLEVLNKVFERTFFPSTQLRAELGRQLGMNPRTVQIWFQNRRQAIRTKERGKDKPDLTETD